MIASASELASTLYADPSERSIHIAGIRNGNLNGRVEDPPDILKAFKIHAGVRFF